jgi:glycosyltransferase involved in cell wall biosynthesis
LALKGEKTYVSNWIHFDDFITMGIRPKCYRVVNLFAGDLMATLKVAWDNYFARRNEAGTGVYAAHLLQQLVNRSDLQLQILKGWLPHAGKTLARRAARSSADLLWAHMWLPARLWCKQFDLLHSPAFIAPLVAPCPVVVTVHDITYLLFPANFSEWWLTYMKLIMPTILRSAAAIISVSEYSKHDIVKAYGICSAKVHVVSNGVDHARFHPGVRLDKKWARSFAINDGYLLHVGTPSYRKNIPTLLRAVAQLRSKGKLGKRQLVLAGCENPALRGASEIYQVIEQLELADVVVLPGHVPDTHLPGLYADAAVLIMPSLYEGFGFPVLESMAIGTPVVASATSSLSEVGGDAALFCPPHDPEAFATAIAEVLESSSLTEKLRQKGLRRAQQFSWHRAAEETIAVYRSVTH